MKRTSIGLRLFNARKSRGITQQELADKIGMTKRMIANYEGTSEGPTIERLNELAQALGVTVSYLLGESTLKNIEPEFSPALRKHVDKLKNLPPKDLKKVLEYADLLGSANGKN